MYCHSMHYHQCAIYDDASAAEPGRPTPRRLDTTVVNVVNTSYGVLQHYRACSACWYIPAPCNQLLANATYVDDNVLRYRPQLMENVRRVLDNIDDAHRAPPPNRTRTA